MRKWLSLKLVKISKDKKKTHWKKIMSIFPNKLHHVTTQHDISYLRGSDNRQLWKVFSKDEQFKQFTSKHYNVETWLLRQITKTLCFMWKNNNSRLIVRSHYTLLIHRHIKENDKELIKDLTFSYFFCSVKFLFCI